MTSSGLDGAHGVPMGVPMGSTYEDCLCAGDMCDCLGAGYKGDMCDHCLYAGDMCDRAGHLEGRDSSDRAATCRVEGYRLPKRAI